MDKFNQGVEETEMIIVSKAVNIYKQHSEKG